MNFNIKHRIRALLLAAVLILTSLPAFSSDSPQLTSSNACIRVLDSGIAVLAHPSASSGYISSATLLDSLSCSWGELAYVDSNKEEVVVSNVTNGYIRIADGSGEYTYLPILTRGETLFGDFGLYESANIDGGSTLSTKSAGVGGKSAEDEIYEFKADASTTDFDYVSYSVSKVNQVRTSFTAVVNVFTKGGASAQIDCTNDGTLLQYNSDGSYTYNYNGTLKHGGYLSQGRWHQLAFVYDHARFRYHIYIDGNFITDNTCTNYTNVLRFGISEGSVDGSVLYDDFQIYRGYYYPSDYELNNENSYDAAIDNQSGTVYYDPAAITSAQQLADAIMANTNASSAMIFADSSFKEMADSLTSSSVVVATSPNGGKIHYYTVSDEPSTQVFTSLSEGVLEACITSNLGGRILILAAYCDTELVAIETSKLISPGSCTVGMLYDAECSYKTFVRKYDLITPVSYTEDIRDTGADYSANCFINNDFSAAMMFYSYPNGNTIELVSDSPLGSALHFKRLAASDFYVQTGGVSSDDSVIIYEFDIMLENYDTAFKVVFEDDVGSRLYPASLIKGGIFKLGGSSSSLTVGKCHNIALALDFSQRKVKCYFDRELMGETAFNNSNFGTKGAWGTWMKIHVTPNTDLDPEASLADDAEFYLDNIKAYASPQPLTSVSQPLRKISLSSGHNLLSKDPTSGIIAPSVDDILESYAASESYNAHPRLHASKADFTALANAIQSNDYLSSWYGKLLSKANHIVTTSVPPSYELDANRTLLWVSREVLENMYTLGMAYQLTGHQKYADRAWVDLETVCRKFPDWHPIHDIDTAEMCTAVAIGYDWMYDAFTPLMRKHIENAMYDKALYEAALAYQMNKAPLSGFANDDDNRSIVTNAGITMASLALLDVYPDECAYLLKNTIHSSSYGLSNFAPDGAWYEGPRYWEYAMQYTAKMISSLDSVLGTSFGLSGLDGLDTAAEYMIYMQSSNGVFSYGNSSQIKLYCPEMMWLSNKYENPDITSIYLDRASDSVTGGEDLALALLWYNTSISANDSLNLSLDKFYDDGENELITLRQSWNENSPFVGIIAGNTIEQLDGGSFVYDYDGIRWAIDPGAATYTQSGYWDTTIGGQRWKIFKSRAEAHNTIVTNPASDNDHSLPSYAKLNIVSQSDTDAIITVDTSNLLIGASSGKRGFWYCDDRSSLVVRDEVTLSESGDAYWFMITRADVEVDSSGATLTQDGKSLRLDFTCDKAAQIYTTSFTPLNSGAIQVDADKDASLKRIIIKLEDITDFNLTVKLTPCAISGTDVLAYNIPISNWKGGN